MTQYLEPSTTNTPFLLNMVIKELLDKAFENVKFDNRRVSTENTKFSGHTGG